MEKKMQHLTWNELMNCTFKTENTFLKKLFASEEKKNVGLFLLVHTVFQWALTAAASWQPGNNIGAFLLLLLFFFILQENSCFSKVEQEVMPQTNA